MINGQLNLLKEKLMKTGFNHLKELEKVQCTDGNWNYDPYMHGMANGIILAVAILEDRQPVYLKAPKIWLCNTPLPIEPIGADECNLT